MSSFGITGYRDQGHRGTIDVNNVTHTKKCERLQNGLINSLEYRLFSCVHQVFYIHNVIQIGRLLHYLKKFHKFPIIFGEPDTKRSLRFLFHCLQVITTVQSP